VKIEFTGITSERVLFLFTNNFYKTWYVRISHSLSTLESSLTNTTVSTMSINFLSYYILSYFPNNQSVVCQKLIWNYDFFNNYFNTIEHSNKHANSSFNLLVFLFVSCYLAICAKIGSQIPEKVYRYSD
jgi:hypothetical protein